MNATTRARITAYWVGVFGPAAAASEQGRVVVAHSAALGGYAGLYVVIRQNRVLVSAPGHLVASVTEWSPDPREARDPTRWQRHLPGCTVLGPSAHAFADRFGDPGLVGGPNAVRTTVRDLAPLRARVTAAEWEEAGLDGPVKRGWAIMDAHGLPLAAAVLTPFDGCPSDLGVLTASTHRGQGLATRVAAHATRDAITRCGIARWRTLTTNHASAATARRLGFSFDCLQLAVIPQAPQVA